MAGRHLIYRAVHDVGWEHMRVECSDDGLAFILGYTNGKWKFTRRDPHGIPVRFDDGSTVKVLCHGVDGDCDLVYEGDDELWATVPVSGGVSHHELVDYVTTDYISQDGGQTWRLAPS